MDVNLEFSVFNWCLWVITVVVFSKWVSTNGRRTNTCIIHARECDTNINHDAHYIVIYEYFSILYYTIVYSNSHGREKHNNNFHICITEQRFSAGVPIPITLWDQQGYDMKVAWHPFVSIILSNSKAYAIIYRETLLQYSVQEDCTSYIL